jgi:GTP-binding protein
VTTKALQLGLKPIVVVNKVDRPDGRADEVLNEVFDLLLALGANEEQLDFKYIFASSRQGWAVDDLKDERKDLTPLFQAICDRIPVAKGEEGSFAMLATTLTHDPYLGRILTGRVYSGTAKLNMPVKVLSRDGTVIEQARLSKILAYRGIEKTPVDMAEAGDIVAIAGLEKATVADTICAMDVTTAIAAQPIDPPTLSMTFSVNDSPLAGKEGTKLTSRIIADRLYKEADSNVSIKIIESPGKDAFEVAGRGELQLGVLIEQMRREGFELSISRPRVIYKTDEETGKKLEPIEEAVIDVDDEFTGVVVEKMGMRKGEMVDMRPSGGGKTRIIFHIPSRGLIGYQGEFLTDTRGTGVLSRLFHGYAPFKGTIEGRRNGALISNGTGNSVAYALWNLEDRGMMFIESGVPIYEGMIVGEHNRDNDLEINVLRGKQLTNVRASGKDEAIRLTPPKILKLEEAIAYIQEDELVEVTPKSIRLRKTHLDPNDRKRFQRSKAD